MKPRFATDYRLLCWMLLFLPLPPVLSLCNPELAPLLLPIGVYLAYCTGVASHNHNHCPVFTSRALNSAYSIWLSVFYGYPTFAWIPTHNQNHHKFTNGPGDDTQTSRYARHNSLWCAVTYPLASIAYQGPAIVRYIAAARHRPRAFSQLCLQYAAVVLGHAGYLAAGVVLYGVAEGVFVYLLAMGIPSAFSIWSMMFTNFVQHVDCDPTSSDNHSRNFVGRKTNWLLFNAGYHTVHHEHPGAHWSCYPELHAARAAKIAPELNQATLVGYCAKTYLGIPGRTPSELVTPAK